MALAPQLDWLLGRIRGEGGPVRRPDGASRFAGRAGRTLAQPETSDLAQPETARPQAIGRYGAAPTWLAIRLGSCTCAAAAVQCTPGPCTARTRRSTGVRLCVCVYN